MTSSSEPQLEPQLVLASASPRRRELLKQIGVSFEVRAVAIPEERRSGENPHDYVSRLAREKAQAVQQYDGDMRYYLGADTIVVQRDRVFEKPRDQAQCVAILSELSSREHEVMTSVCVCGSKDIVQETVRTRVCFRKISPAEMARYWASGEPRDKAGAYGIQGLGAVFVAELHGSYSNVVGLPLFETAALLAKLNIPIWQQG